MWPHGLLNLNWQPLFPQYLRIVYNKSAKNRNANSTAHTTQATLPGSSKNPSTLGASVVVVGVVVVTSWKLSVFIRKQTGKNKNTKYVYSTHMIQNDCLLRSWNLALPEKEKPTKTVSVRVLIWGISWDYGIFRHSSNEHAQPSSGARCLIFGRTLPLLSYFMCANSEGSGEYAHSRLRECAGSPDPSLVVYVISTIISFDVHQGAQAFVNTLARDKGLHLPACWSVFAVHMKKLWVRGYQYKWPKTDETADPNLLLMRMLLCRFWCAPTKAKL